MKSRILNHVDFDKVNAVLEGFSKATGFATAILDLDGTILSQSGWRQVCTEFHRKNPDTALNCSFNDTDLTNKTRYDEKYHFVKCNNGLIAVVVPIVIREEHIANLYAGQFFFEEPNISFFRRKAQIYGFDENSYLQSIEKVPVLSKEKSEAELEFLLNITQMIIEMTAEKLNQIELNEEMRKREAALLESQVQLKQYANDLLESQRIAHVGTWRLDIETNQVVWSDELYNMYGFDPRFPPPPYTEHMKLFTPESWVKLSTALERTRILGIPYELELQTVMKDGSNGWMWVRGEASRDSNGNIISLWGSARDITESKKAKEALRESEEKYRNITENISDVVWTTDLSLKVTYISASVRKVFMLTPEDYMKLPLEAHFTQNSMGKINSLLSAELEREKDPNSEKGRSVQVELEHFRSDGSIIWVAMNVSFIRDNNGNAIGFLGVSRDITERKQAEALLKESEEKFRYLFENSLIGKSLTLPSGEINFNHTLCKMLGYTAEELKDKKWQEITLPDDIELNEREISKLISGATDSVQFNKRYIRKDGSIMWGNVLSAVRRSENGNPIYFMTSIIDITERINAEESLKQSEERFRLLFNEAPLGYQSLDAQGLFLDVNQRWLDTFGYSREEVIGKWFGDFLCPEYVDSFHHCFSIFKAQGHIHSEFEMLRKDKERLFIAFEGKIAYDSNGNFMQTHCILQDITNQRAAEVSLRESEERYKFLFEYSGVGIGYYTTDGVVISYNQKALENIGGNLEDYVGKSFYELFQGEQAEIYFSRMKYAIASDNPQVYEDYILINSQKKWFSSTFTKVTNAAGEIIGVQIASLDITQRKQAEEALEENEQANKLLLEHLFIGIVLHNADSSIAFSNPLANQLLGLSADKMQNKFVSDKAWCFYDTHAEPLPVESYPFSLVKKDQKLINYEMGISQAGKKDIKWILVNGFAIPDKTGNLDKVLISFIDITEKKQAEEAALLNTFKFQSLFDQMTSGAAIYKVVNDGVYGSDYIIQDFNKAALKAEGKEKSEVLGKSLYDLRPNIDQYGLIPVFRRVWQTGEPAYYPSKIYIDEKFSNWYENHVYKLISGEIVAIFDDVTDRKRAEENTQHLAYHDYLTDTYNRRFFENEFDKKNTGEYYPLAIVTGDLNGLKLINDSFGHYSGDSAIQQFAIEIQKRIPEDAILARVGGDEFSIILARSSGEEAKLLATELQSNIRFDIKDNKGNDVDAEITATFGYSCQTFPGQGLDELAKEAETFIYRRKFLANASKRSNVIDAIMSTLFEKSEREQKHSLRVSSIATSIATAMGLDDTAIAKVRVAGSLHDIGKIGIDESLLKKVGQLSDQEWELIKQHPIRSARILSSIDEYLDIVPIVKAHHERVDGNGYPAGLSDKQIPLEAKIIAVADSFDAMTVSRPYRNRISFELATEELKRCSGSQFDAEIVNIFITKVMPKIEQEAHLPSIN